MIVTIKLEHKTKKARCAFILRGNLLTDLSGNRGSYLPTLKLVIHMVSWLSHCGGSLSIRDGIPCATTRLSALIGCPSFPGLSKTVWTVSRRGLLMIETDRSDEMGVLPHET